MKPDTSRWRSSPTYDYVGELVAPDLAWEWLRRNGEYQTDFAGIEQPVPDRQHLTARALHRWGLRFPCSPKLHSGASARLLVAGHRHRRRAADHSPLRFSVRQ
ncbi:MAG: DUF6499 domain-containing protein [Pseudolabrys sp.]|nr:DUF6499 domain-containing protein [Pseudolabrys sp.]